MKKIALLILLAISTACFAQKTKKTQTAPAAQSNCAEQIQTAIAMVKEPLKAQHLKDEKIIALQKESLLRRGTEINRLQGLLLETKKQLKTETARATDAENKYSAAIALLQEKHCRRALKILNQQ